MRISVFNKCLDQLRTCLLVFYEVEFFLGGIEILLTSLVDCWTLVQMGLLMELHWNITLLQSKHLCRDLFINYRCYYSYLLLLFLQTLINNHLLPKVSFSVYDEILKLVFLEELVIISFSTFFATLIVEFVLSDFFQQIFLKFVTIILRNIFSPADQFLLKVY